MNCGLAGLVEQSSLAPNWELESLRGFEVDFEGGDRIRGGLAKQVYWSAEQVFCRSTSYLLPKG